MAHEIEEGQDGLFSICVFKAADFSDDEIHEIFGRFGTIYKINRSGNMTFLRYQTHEEAVGCYEGMQADTRFTVKPGKRKGGSDNPGRNKDSRFGNMNRNDNSRGKRELGGSGDFGRPSAVGNARRPPPKLIPFPNTAVSGDETAEAKKPAKVLVIGNLHPKMGQNNIYDLCNKCQVPPLHVAMKLMKRPPYPQISYAFVYVRNDKEVDAIISSLNNLKLNGHMLVVNSVEKLSEEGRALCSTK